MVYFTAFLNKQFNGIYGLQLLIFFFHGLLMSILIYFILFYFITLTGFRTCIRGTACLQSVLF